MKHFKGSQSRHFSKRKPENGIKGSDKLLVKSELVAVSKAEETNSGDPQLLNSWAHTNQQSNRGLNKTASEHPKTAQSQSSYSKYLPDNTADSPVALSRVFRPPFHPTIKQHLLEVLSEAIDSSGCEISMKREGEDVECLVKVNGHSAFETFLLVCYLNDSVENATQSAYGEYAGNYPHNHQTEHIEQIEHIEHLDHTEGTIPASTGTAVYRPESSSLNYEPSRPTSRMSLKFREYFSRKHSGPKGKVHSNIEYSKSVEQTPQPPQPPQVLLNDLGGGFDKFRGSDDIDRAMFRGHSYDKPQCEYLDLKQFPVITTERCAITRYGMRNQKESDSIEESSSSDDPFSISATIIGSQSSIEKEKTSGESTEIQESPKPSHKMKQNSFRVRSKKSWHSLRHLFPVKQKT